MTKPIIGRYYDGPCYDKPCLRQMPRHWVLEETARDSRAPWYRRADRWSLILLVLSLLVACAQTAHLVMS